MPATKTLLKISLMANKQFVHLHVHSHYSLLDGLGKIDELTEAAKSMGMNALALSDHGVMYGAIEFYLSCKDRGIKPIIGQEAYVARGSHKDKNTAETKPYHLLLLAKNEEGYKNLIKLTTIAHLEGHYYRPRIDRDLLSRYSKGLIATSACLASETSAHILQRDLAAAEQTINEYREIFSPDSYYLELQHHPSISEQHLVNQHLIDLSRKLKVPLVATNDVHYARSEDHDTHDLLVCVQTGKLVSDSKRMIYNGDFSLKSPEQMYEHFRQTPSAIENTLKIADLVNLEIPLDQNLLPNFPLPEGETEESLLEKWCREGIKKRYGRETPQIKTRLNYELEIVFKMGYPGYFLIVADLVNFARSRNIYVGPGRGSAAGSLIAYLTGITDIDPLKYGLMFERFLDASRISMPDIDIDFEDTRRAEVIEFLRQKYGQNHVAGIITFGTIMARAAVRDVARVLGVSYAKADQIAKAVPPPIQGRHIPLAKTLSENAELQQLYTQDAEAKQVLDGATKLEGTVRHASQHASAIVLTKEPLENYVSVQLAPGGDVHQITQYSMGPIEKIGLLKMDILGLANLTVMHQAVEIIEAVYQKKIDIYNLPLDDKRTFELLGRGETTGVFQLESAGMKRYIKELKPSRFEDIIAMVALYRPGPMQWIQSFLNRKNGKEPITYLHPLAEKSLKETYGIPVYQEEVMQLAKDMCGFTGQEADTLRKAMGKKIPKLMNEMKAKFVAGAMKNGVEKRQAESIFKQLEDFAAYAFNKSHSACYAMIAYQTAYLKAHYPDCFMAALMTSDLHNIDRLSIEIAECEKMGIKVLPPDVNESFAAFAVVKDSSGSKNSFIRFGMGAIKNVGEAAAKRIVEERKKSGPYQSLEDFLSRASLVLNKKVLESLTKSGSLDRFGKRSDLVGAVELMIKYISNGRHKNQDQLSIFGHSGTQELAKIKLSSVSEDKTLYLTWERELLGLYLSDHPLKRFQESLRGKVMEISQLKDLPAPEQPIRLAGIVTSVKTITTKSGEQMAFAAFEDLGGEIELVIFPGVFNRQKDLWQNDALLLVEGRLSSRDGESKLLLEQAWRLGQDQLPTHSVAARPLRSRETQTDTSYTVELPAKADRHLVAQIRSILERHPGQVPVELRLLQNGQVKSLRIKLKVQPSVKMQSDLAKVLGA